MYLGNNRNRYQRPTDIDWDAVRQAHNNKTAKELAALLGISVTAVYQASYAEKIQIKKVLKR